jgi:hypothetical protein
VRNKGEWKRLGGRRGTVRRGKKDGRFRREEEELRKKKERRIGEEGGGGGRE